MITYEQLKSALDYDQETGVFKWKIRGGRSVVPGAIAGGDNGKGHISIGYKGKRYMAHRLAWLYTYGEWPKHQIDHINVNPADNRIANLRDVSHSVNKQNMRRARADSSIGLAGVSMNHKRYAAHIRLNSKRHYIGTYDTPEEAHSAYVSTKRDLHEGCTI